MRGHRNVGERDVGNGARRTPLEASGGEVPARGEIQPSNAFQSEGRRPAGGKLPAADVAPSSELRCQILAV